VICDRFSPFKAPCMEQYLKLKIISKLRFKSDFDLTLSEVVSK
jgi:hypothetical protein